MLCGYTHIRLPFTSPDRDTYALCGSRYVSIPGYRLQILIWTFKRQVGPGKYPCRLPFTSLDKDR